MVVGAKVCQLTDSFFVVFMCFVCGNFDVSPKTVKNSQKVLLEMTTSFSTDSSRNWQPSATFSKVNS